MMRLLVDEWIDRVHDTELLVKNGTSPSNSILILERKGNLLFQAHMCDDSPLKRAGRMVILFRPEGP
jgi:hypothetical protein